jgi:hypothetical protein
LIPLIILAEEFTSRSSSLCTFLHPPVTSFLFGQNILLSTLFSNTHSLCSPLNVRDQVSHPCRTTSKISLATGNFKEEKLLVTNEFFDLLRTETSTLLMVYSVFILLPNDEISSTIF